ncbi:MAG: hypothetical protein R3B47_04530 [Bacteroidia bacterium]
MRLSLIFLAIAFSLSLQAQVSGKVYIAYTQNVSGLADSIGYYLYPSKQFFSVAGYSARDMAHIGDILFSAPQPGLGGRYDSLQAISISSDMPLGKVPGNFTAGNVETWNGNLVVSCGEAPWLRVLEGSPPHAELFNLPMQNVLNREPYGMTVYRDKAYLWTDSLFCIVDLTGQQLEGTINFPDGFLVQSEFNAVLGAADSVFLLISMGRNTNSRDSVSVYRVNHQTQGLEFRDQYVVPGLLAFPGVGGGDIIHFSRYRAHYDPAAGRIVPEQPGQTFLPGQASSYDPASNTLVVMEEASFNRQFLWLEHGDTIINNLSPMQLPQRTVIVWNSLFIDNLTLPVDPANTAEVRLYPNPAGRFVHIEAEQADSYAIFSIAGKNNGR